MTAMKSKQSANSEHRSNDLSTVQDQGDQFGLNPKTSLPYKFTVGISLGIFAILLVYAVYYYGFFR